MSPFCCASFIYIIEIYLDQNLDLAGSKGASIIRHVTDMNEYFQILKAHPRDYSTIMEPMILEYNIQMMNIQQYLPPSYKDCNFFLDIQGLIMEKRSPLADGINKAYE